MLAALQPTIGLATEKEERNKVYKYYVSFDYSTSSQLIRSSMSYVKYLYSRLTVQFIFINTFKLMSHISTLLVFE